MPRTALGRARTPLPAISPARKMAAVRMVRPPFTAAAGGGGDDVVPPIIPFSIPAVGSRGSRAEIVYNR